MDSKIFMGGDIGVLKCGNKRRRQWKVKADLSVRIGVLWLIYACLRLSTSPVNQIFKIQILSCSLHPFSLRVIAMVDDTIFYLIPKYWLFNRKSEMSVVQTATGHSDWHSAACNTNIDKSLANVLVLLIN